MTAKSDIYIYSDSTCRNLKIRINEHKGFSFNTGIPLIDHNFSVIRKHYRDNDPCNWAGRP